MSSNLKILRQCSFCGKNQLQVKKLISGNDVYICNECISLCYNILVQDDMFGKPSKDGSKITPEAIKEYLDDRVVGQDLAKTILSVAIYNHMQRIANPVVDGVEIEKSNLLFVGPSGVGKTYLIQNVSKLLDIPFVIVDATSLTESGYVGLDVEDCIARLYQASGGDIAKTESGIIYIDEIDKKGRKGENTSVTRDVSGEGVQQALLKMIEGCEVKVPPQGGRKNPHGEFVTINTKNVLFILGGAFVGLEEIVSKRLNKNNNSMGFLANTPNTTDVKEQQNLIKDAKHEDLTKFGLIPELIGRLPVLTPFMQLTEEQLVKILSEPKNAIIKQYQKMFQLEKISLEFRPDALTAIAKDAIEKKTGARGLRSIIEKILLPVQFTLPSLYDKGVSSVIITGGCVTEAQEPVMIYRSETETANDQ
jgi:ATP-dependent Clp protease ATP-binding subunit ClpX